MQFFTAILAFIKAIPDVTALVNKVLDFITLQQELQAAKAALAKREAELTALRAAIASMQAPGHDNTDLNNLFNGVKQ